MRKLFRGKLMAFFKEAIAGGDIKFHGLLKPYQDPAMLKKLIDTLYKADWVVYVKPPFGSPEQVLKYLGGYTHRIAISNHRIISLDNGMVTFAYKDYADKNKRKRMTQTAVEFIRRFLLHALPTRFVRMRHYGFLSNRAKQKKLALCRHLLGGKAPADEPKPKSWQQLIEKLTGGDPLLCPACRKARMTMVLEIPRPSHYRRVA
jgi:hypothetical protein